MVTNARAISVRDVVAAFAITLSSLAVIAPTNLHAAASGPVSIRGSRYGGPSFDGAPNLALASSLVAAGGGAKSFSTAKALESMVGVKLTGAEVARLNRKYGKPRVATWLKAFDFGVRDASRIATLAGIKFPAPNLRHKALASALVTAGLVKRTFYIEYLLDATISHRIHEKVMDDIDVKFGRNADADYHKISNQAFYDLAQALGATSVRLSRFH